MEIEKTKREPIARFKGLAGVGASVFVAETDSGRFYNAVLGRRYKKADAWVNSNSYTEAQLQELIRKANEAFEFMQGHPL